MSRYLLHSWIENTWKSKDMCDSGSVICEFRSINRAVQWADKNLKEREGKRIEFFNRISKTSKQKLVGFYITKDLSSIPLRFSIVYSEHWEDRYKTPDGIYEGQSCLI